MRISDLSSDVCSSDLLGVVQPQLFVDAAGLRLDRTVVGEQDALRAAFDDGGRDRRPRDVGETLRGEDHRDVLLAQDLEPFPDPGRSDEPTAVLQSLMRTPYSVFCLKKHSLQNTTIVPSALHSLPTN